MANRTELLSFGFCKEIEPNINTKVPVNIMKMITLYNTTYKILACGSGVMGELGAASNDITASSKYIEFRELKQITPHYQNIYPNIYSMMVIDVKHRIFVIGNNMDYRLGLQYQDDLCQITNFKQIQLDETPILASKGIFNSNHTFIYTLNNTLYASGKNQHGQFGNGNKSQNDYDTFTLQKIPFFWQPNEEIKEIQCAYEHSLFLTSKNNVYLCGHNENEYILKPKLIYSNIAEIGVGAYHNILLNKNGNLIIFGDSNVPNMDEFGYLGSKNNADKICEYFKNNKIKIKTICCGKEHALVLTTNNKCFSFGQNRHGQCGTGIAYSWKSELILKPYLLLFNGCNDEYIIQISCGDCHNLLLSNKNRAYSFGGNSYAQSSPFVNGDIHSPHYLDKQNELKIDINSYIDNVKCLSCASLIIINENKKLRI
eukprot:301031_1